ncbi:uncharacterized protein EV420DRAFT_979515 [Desarmillaria tabescens]|uniref:DUF6533 domain-containing protein n=1 Tax=Armillaria tabescens TaxID=1929756 RepID=A0AA39JMH7_ARMTA|nr:uncharacterized protein EV420DRAFT_979515 [Desarmillaria tabescens]KAK0444987.1 hypothetical protein EV420DRAFT_979515 [Desarmillaria tabescens]
MRMSSAFLSLSSISFTAGATVLLYDLILLLPTEIDYIWLPRPVHPLLLLFALNRYLPLVDMTLNINWLLHRSSSMHCGLYSFITGPLVAFGIFTSQVILMIRTYAIWDRHRAVFWCFIGTGVFCFTPGVVGLAIELKDLQSAQSSNNPGCFHVSPSLSKLLYIPVLVSETIIASLTLFKGVQHLRRSSHPFVTELYASGMLFYVCLFLISLANILIPMWTYALTPFLGYFQRILHSILSSRVMLLILEQRGIRRPAEELYTDDFEVSECFAQTRSDSEIQAESNIRSSC